MRSGPMFRAAIVKAQDTARARLRVTFTDRDQVTSLWLPILFPKTQNDKAYWIPDIGEQVICAMDAHGEDGVVLGAIYSNVDTPPVSSADKLHLTMKDGATFEYDRSAHALAIALGAAASLNITVHGATIAVDSSGLTINAGSMPANVESSGTVNVNGANVVLAGGGPAIARVGDTVTCPAGTGTIATGSLKATSG